MTTIMFSNSGCTGPLTSMIKQTGPPGMVKLELPQETFGTKVEGHPWFLGRIQEWGRGRRELGLWIFNT